MTAACLLPAFQAGLAHDEKETEGGAPGIQHRLGPARCVDGQAGEFPCHRIDLLSAVPVADMGADQANDIWGWTDPATGSEYALVGLVNGVGFVDLTDPEAPRVTGHLPTHTGVSAWRDLKVYDDHLFVVSEVGPQSGDQRDERLRLRGRHRRRRWLCRRPPHGRHPSAHLATIGRLFCR
jgi:hypothetical protein